MNRLPAKSGVVFLLALLLGELVFGQPLEDNNKDAVRVTVAVNSDGSRTTYEFDPPHHRATATTTETDGKLRGKIRYEIDQTGRFSSGIIYGADDQFRFKSLYKYSDGGRLSEETHLNQKGVVINRLVYHYDSAGKSLGYSIYDSSGKLLASSSTPSPTPKPQKSVSR